ncbi:MAG TPA: cytochrome c peroxidase, partial [Polyangia bacterium]
MPSSNSTASRAAALSFLLIAAGAVYSSLTTLRQSALERARAAQPLRRRDATAGPRDDHAGTAARAAVGKQIFFDANLSDPPGTSCASCHDPAHGYAGNHGSTIGVARGSRPDHFARRNTPSVMYLGFVHRFHWHWEEDAPLPDGAGGFFWDGRSDSLAALVEQPLLNPDEMNGGSRARVAEILRAAAYAEPLRVAFGAGALDTPDEAMRALGAALEAFLGSDELSPFTSRYDDFVRGRATLTAEEERGLSLFRDPAKGNCAFCHKLDPGSSNPRRSPFSDFGFEVVGAPRNLALPAGRAPDLGLCTARPGTHADEERLCGAFRTPSLRNVATRSRFLHNGALRRLRDVVAFYATRTIDTRRWYPSGVAFD